MRSLMVMAMMVLIAAGGCGSKSDTKPAAAPKGPPPSRLANDPEEEERLKGGWQVVAIEAGGKPVPEDRVKGLNLHYVFAGDRVTIRRPDRPEVMTAYTLVTTAKPWRIMIHQTPPVRGIYEVDGNKLRLCVSVDPNPNADFPTEFVSKASPKTDLLTLERR